MWSGVAMSVVHAAISRLASTDVLQVLGRLALESQLGITRLLSCIACHTLGAALFLAPQL